MVELYVEGQHDDKRQEAEPHKQDAWRRNGVGILGLEVEECVGWDACVGQAWGEQKCLLLEPTGDQNQRATSQVLIRLGQKQSILLSRALQTGSQGRSSTSHEKYTEIIHPLYTISVHHLTLVDLIIIIIILIDFDYNAL